MTNRFPTARPAATIILTRPAGRSFEVYLLKRSTASKFMADNHVFPGGVVEEEDGDVAAWSGLVNMDSEAIERRLGGGLDYREALTYGVAAIRETFEEAGVLMAQPAQPESDALAQAFRVRESVQKKKAWFRPLVVECRLNLELAGLFRWAHWVTPQEMKLHFDTRFFLSVLPTGQTCRPDNRETTSGIWVQPLEGLEANLKGEMALSPPTIVTLQQLTKFGKHAELLEAVAERPWGEPLRPRYITMGKDAMIVEPWDPDFELPRININPEKLGECVLPAGADFSRIWLHEGLWRPVGLGSRS